MLVHILELNKPYVQCKKGLCSHCVVKITGPCIHFMLHSLHVIISPVNEVLLIHLNAVLFYNVEYL